MKSRSLRLVLALALLVVAAVALQRSISKAIEVPRGRVPGELPAALAGSEARAVEAPAVVRLVEIADGLDRPLYLTHAGDGSGRLFVVEQGGLVRILRDGKVSARPFLDFRSHLDTSDGERGLLGLAFAPDYRASGMFFLAHTAPGPANAISRARVSSDPDRADPASVRRVLSIDDPASNHNGGMIVVGPDGYLWIGTGDGGSAGDPWNNAQDLGSLHGKLLRIDGGSEPYRVPADNPFTTHRGARPEIWARGLRNPWRFSFDRATGELWTGDVGQYSWEEIDVEDPKRGGGLNYGWRVLEGRHCFEPASGCETAGTLLPVHEYSHREGCSVTGGYVYRGQAIESLRGHYLFSDYCRGTLWSLVREGDGRARVGRLLETGLNVSSFGEDEAGEIYLCDHGGGRIWKLMEGSAGGAGGGV